MDIDRVLAKVFPELRATYTNRDTMLYGLGVGACNDPMNASQLHFVYEGGLQALPSMSSVLAHPGFWLKEPELKINWVKLIHAEQGFELTSPLPASGEVFAKYRVSGVLDKGEKTGALMYFEKTLFNTDRSPIGTVTSTYFLRGDGGCGNWGATGRELPEVPTTSANGSIDTPTLAISALIYRLSGDYNPLHVDPNIAAKAGFKMPILQGLCTYGVACQALIQAIAGGDAFRLRGMWARFTKPVYPGDTIRTDYWKSTNGSINFRCTTLERNEVVLDRGLAIFN